MIRVFNKKRRNVTAARMNGFVGELRAHANPAVTGTGIIEVEQGWLYCNGATLSRTTYSTLFGLIGTSYGVGAGDGLTFSLPDSRARGLAFALDGQASGGNRMAATSIGTVLGTETVVLTKAQVPKHAHDQGTLAVPSGGSHSHTSSYSISNNVANNGYDQSTILKPSVGNSGSIGATGSTAGGGHTHPSGEWSGATDGGTGLTTTATAHSNVAPSVPCSVEIRY